MNTFLESIREHIRSIMTVIAIAINSVSGGRITPNMITMIGLLAHIYIAWLIATENFTLAAILLIFFGLFDAVDGALARIQGTSSKKGMLLDSITDRLKEVLLYGGITYAFVSSATPYFAVWAVLACGISLIVSYINAWGEVVTKDKQHKTHATNKTFRTGIMTYDVRMFVLVIGLLSGYLEQAVVFIAIFAFWTAIERFYLVTKQL